MDAEFYTCPADLQGLFQPGAPGLQVLSRHKVCDESFGVLHGL